MEEQPKRLIVRFQEIVRLRHLSIHTERTYWDWIRRYIKFNGCKSNMCLLRDPGAMIESFLKDMSPRVSASTQNQALNALIFLYKQVLRFDVGKLNLPRAERAKRLPTIISHAEAMNIIDRLKGQYKIIGRLLYGCGMRVSEPVRLRVKDVDFDSGLITIRQGKGDVDRLVPIPKIAIAGLREAITKAKAQHVLDLKAALGSVYLPDSLAKKYPKSDKQFAWQWVFPSRSVSKDPRSGILRRHHISIESVQKAVAMAVKEAGIDKPVSPHSFRHGYITELRRADVPLETVQKLAGHMHIETTMQYNHFLTDNIASVKSPVDR